MLGLFAFWTFGSLTFRLLDFGDFWISGLGTFGFWDSETSGLLDCWTLGLLNLLTLAFWGVFFSFF